MLVYRSAAVFLIMPSSSSSSSSSSASSSASSSSSGRQEGPPGDDLGGGFRGSPAEAAEGQTDAEGDGRVHPREVTASFQIRPRQTEAAG